jgi:hypothetical protein
MIRQPSTRRNFCPTGQFLTEKAKWMCGQRTYDRLGLTLRPVRWRN